MTSRRPGTTTWMAAFLAAALVLVAVASRAEDRCGLEGQPAASGWSDTERWAWGEICAGRRANLKEQPVHLHPEGGEPSRERRRLSTKFLEAMLLDKPFRDALSRRRIEIVGAWFADNVQFFSTQIDFELWLNDCEFDGDFDLWGSTLKHSLSLDGSRFAKPISLIRAQVEGNLLVGYKTRLAGLWLMNAEIRGDVEAESATSEGPVQLDGATIGGRVSLTKAVLRRTGPKPEQQHPHLLRIENARIGRDLDLTEVELAGPALIDGSTLGGGVNLRGGRFEQFEVRRTTIGGAFDASGASFAGDATLESTQVKASIYLQGASVGRRLAVRFSRVDENLDLTLAKLQAADLSATIVERELRLGSKDGRIVWRGEASLVLANVKAGWLNVHDQILADKKLSTELTGLTYQYLGGAGTEGLGSSRSGDWFIDWLAHDRSFSPQPYEQLAESLRKSGYPGKAERVLSAKRMRERDQAWRDGELGVWFHMWFTELLLGYGNPFERYARLLSWVMLFVVIGVVVLKVTRQKDASGQLLGATYSLDVLVPVIQFRKDYANVELSSPAREYFYLHRAVGYLLSVALAGALSGIVKPD